MQSLPNPITLAFATFNLTVDKLDKGGTYYKAPDFASEINTALSHYIATHLKPRVCVDIGANYGFTSLITLSHNPEAQLIAIEASPKLIPFLEANLSQNPRNKYRIINAICGSINTSASHFSLNPNGSQDNRIKGPDTWESITVPSITLDTILQDVQPEESLYIKIDAQGSEEAIFQGAEALKTRTKWLLKTEFGPYWLRSQGTNPAAFLKQLTQEYIVHELPKRFTRNWSISPRKQRIKPKESKAFVEYLENLAVNVNGDKIGWCDLLVLPRGYLEYSMKGLL